MQQVRNVSKYLDRDRTSKAIREKFLDYFIKEHNHVFVRSSPVVPYCDPTVAFVNAGMNQVCVLNQVHFHQCKTCIAFVV